ncbi:four helix bundle protein [Candidatus Uhrbacteria bacterium]|nr:four helix bundle protein [Candidatus Uhrbacteria bacterium]
MASEIKTFQDLEAWQEAHKFVLFVYEITNNFPKSEKFSLINQMRRAGVSVTSNIAEGFSRLSYSEKIRFYSIAHSSLTELQNQIILSHDVHYLTDKNYQDIFSQSVKVHKILNGLIKSSRLRL